MPIRDQLISDTPVLVVDFETTGLRAGSDRVLEVTAVRLDPGQKPKVVLNSLVNPKRPVAGTEIHGITDDDIRDAPTFDDLAGDLLRAMSGAMFAAYNVYFEMRFLQAELAQLRALPSLSQHADVPHMCLMYLRPLLGLGKKCSLVDACKLHQISAGTAHASLADTLAASQLYMQYREQMNRLGLRTFGDLAALRAYKFADSFAQPPIPPQAAAVLPPCPHAKPRVGATTPEEIARQQRLAALRDYWEVLKEVVHDLTVDAEEFAELQAKGRHIQPADIRMLHARMFSAAIQHFTDDHHLSDKECTMLSRLHKCLRQLGWAPGDAVPLAAAS